jgi:hypothetical protein
MPPSGKLIASSSFVAQTKLVALETGVLHKGTQLTLCDYMSKSVVFEPNEAEYSAWYRFEKYEQEYILLMYVCTQSLCCGFAKRI